MVAIAIHRTKNVIHKYITFATWKLRQYACFHPIMTARSINSLLITTNELSYPMLQCAAVSTQYLWTNDPPQKCWPLVLCRDTMYLMEFGAAVWPPTIRPCLSTWPVWKQKHLQDTVYEKPWQMNIELLNITVNMATGCFHLSAKKLLQWLVRLTVKKLKSFLRAFI